MLVREGRKGLEGVEKGNERAQRLATCSQSSFISPNSWLATLGFLAIATKLNENMSG
jgi:hypothetical protein